LYQRKAGVLTSFRIWLSAAVASRHSAAPDRRQGAKTGFNFAVDIAGFAGNQLENCNPIKVTYALTLMRMGEV
jgi:hypothetical protein